jgi:hypothetical protein
MHASATPAGCFQNVWHSLATLAAQLFDTTPHRSRPLPTLRRRPARPEASHLETTRTGHARRPSNRRYGLSRARHPFRVGDGANHKVWTGRLYTDSLARSQSSAFCVSAMRVKFRGAPADVRQMFQAYLDKSTPYTPYRWGGTGALLIAFGVRIFVAQGWYIGMLPCFLLAAIAPLSAPQRHVYRDLSH